MNSIFENITLPKLPSYPAPDGSEIRLLLTFEAGGLCHCTLPAGSTSIAVKHKTVEEIWYCLSGEGKIWQKSKEGNEYIIDFSSGDCFTIPVGNSFQFKNRGEEPLCILIATMPRWPGDDEAVIVEGAW